MMVSTVMTSSVKKDPFSMCDIMVTCENGMCACPTSHTDNEILCDELSYAGIDIPRVRVISITRIPLITIRSSTYRDDH